MNGETNPLPSTVFSVGEMININTENFQENNQDITQQQKSSKNAPSLIDTACNTDILKKILELISPLEKRKTFTGEKKFEQMETYNYTSTTELNRILLKIFQFTERPVHKSNREIFRFEENDKEYVVFVDGNIGMNHKELLDVIFFAAKKKAIINNKLTVITGLYTAKKAFNKRSSSFFINLLKDLKMEKLCIAEIDSNNKYVKTRPLDGFITDFKIIESNKYDNKQALNIKVVLSQFLTNCFYSQIMIYYDPFPISEFKYGINKAIANFLLSHKKSTTLNYKFETLYKTLSIKESDYKNFNYRIKQESDIYLKIGFIVDKKENKITNSIPKSSSTDNQQ